MAISYVVRNATTTNGAGHSYGTVYSSSRWFTSFDLSGWDEVSSANFNGPTADGTIACSWALDDDPPEDLMS